MLGPNLPRTREEQFDEAYDREMFERALEKGEICFHGWPTGQCKQGCEEEKQI